MQNYKELRVWRESHGLTLEIYKETLSFPENERYGLISQIRRSSLLIPSNIAEGCGKFRQLDIANFFQIALASTNETDYLLLLSKDLNYLPIKSFEKLSEIINKIRAMLITLIKKIRTTITTKG